MKKTADFLLDMLYPKKCPLCHQILKEKRPADLSGVFRKGQAYIRSQVYEMRKTGKNGRGIL
mgnify:CR=1 FL=1